MASILRSSKFVRYIAGFARNIVINPPREFDGNFVNTVQCFCGAVPRLYATQANTQYDQGLEKRLRTLDQDVRRSGRISKRDIEDVLEEIRNSRSATSSQSLLVIRCCGNLVPEELPEIRTKLVQEIWNTLKKLNVPMDISHYNALLRVYLENEHSFSPTEFLRELEMVGIEPNRVTYQRLIARYCQLGDIEGATRILEFMREKQLPVNENVFNALIHGHSESGDMESAKGILAVMSQAGIEPSADTYTTLMCGYAKIGEMATIKSLLEECENKEIFLLDKDYLDIIYALSINGFKEYVPEILDKTKKAFGYSQDAINLILRLINKNEEETAFLILKSIPRSTKEDGTFVPIGSFFLKQMVKANRPFEKIFEYCNLFENEGLHDRALHLVTETSLQLGKDKLCYKLLEELNKRGQQIRHHFFWPLLVAKGNEKTEKGIIEVLKKMNDFNLSPNLETLRDYVLPNLTGKSSEIIEKLSNANISVSSSAHSLALYLLQKYDIEEAALIVSRVPAYYSPEIFRRILTNAFYKTQNAEAYARIVRMIYENFDRKEFLKSDVEIDSSWDKTEIVGRFLLDLTISPRAFAEVVENVLKSVVQEGLTISISCAEKIQDKLGEKMTPIMSDLLGKLTSGELTLTPLTQTPHYVPAAQMNIPQLERLIFNLKKKGQDVRGLKRQLLSLYYKEKEVDKMEEILKELSEDENFKMTAGIYAQLADAYAYHEQLDKALQAVEKLKEIDGNFTIDDIKILRIAMLLNKNKRYDESFELLSSWNPERISHEYSFVRQNMCWRFFNALAEEGKEEELEKFFNLIHTKGYFTINNILLGPLIKVHLVNNNIDKAMEKFEECVNKYRVTPWKNELAAKLIALEDADRLQKLTDLSTTVHGEINSLYDLVFTFVDCGRIRQARKILETPGLQNRPQRLNSICERYQMEGKTKSLEGLKDATKDLNHIDRSDIYYQLLLSYIKQDETEKALGLWTQMQEEDLMPTDEFLLKLGKHLKEKGIKPPFIVPEESAVSVPPPKLTEKSVKNKYIRNLFKQHIREGKLDEALQIHKTNTLDSNDLSELIEKLVQEEKLDIGTELTIELLENNKVPTIRVFRFLLNKLANAGRIEHIETISSKIKPDLKKILSFDNKLCHAYAKGNKGLDYLEKLENEIDNAKEEDLKTLEEKFPRGGSIAIIENSELLSKYETIAKKYAARNIYGPINVLWCHHFINNNLTEAEKIWNDYLQNCPRVMFQRIVALARQNQDYELIEKLTEHLKKSKVSEGALGNAYSCLLDVLVFKKDHENAISTFEQIAKEINLEHINKTALLRIKDVYIMKKKPFDYKIPEKSTSKSSSSFSSSDEERRNQQV